jgi:hypothetical protein
LLDSRQAQDGDQSSSREAGLDGDWLKRDIRIRLQTPQALRHAGIDRHDYSF